MEIITKIFLRNSDTNRTKHKAYDNLCGLAVAQSLKN